MLAALLAGCGPSRDEFLVELARARCVPGCEGPELALYAEDDVECREAVRADGRAATADCGYRRSKANACLEHVEATCGPLEAGDPCSEVFACDDWVLDVR